MKLSVKKFVKVGLGFAGLSAALLVAAQQYPVFRGGAERTGKMPNIDTDTPGRAYLRWWDPSSGVTQLVDNWETGKGAFGLPAGSWIAPSGQQVASSYVDEDITQPSYLYCLPTPAKSYDEYWLPATGTAATFQWQFDSQVGQEFSLYVNLPYGPTGIPSGTGETLYYQQRYQVYEITGVQNPDGSTDPVYQKVDTYATGGGEVRLGNNGLSTNQVYIATGAKITLKLINTTPRDSNEALTDNRTNILVYADAAKAIRGGDELGSTIASPITGIMGNTPSVDPYPIRLFASRNEDLALQVGSEVRSYSLGLTTSYRHNGYKIDSTENGIGGEFRRNIVWSWPAARPTSETTAEKTRYSQEKQDFILGTDIGISRANQYLTYDNLNGSTQPSTGWVTGNTVPGFRGTNYHTTAITTGAATERVYYRPNLPTGTYSIDVWVPGANSAFGTKVEVEITRGPFLLARTTADFTGAQGWYRLRDNTIAMWDSDPSTPLNVAITNHSSEPADALRSSYADTVRFVRQSDLRMTSTPVFATIPIRVGAATQDTDVVIVPMENGRIYCLDARGLYNAGTPTGKTQVYWVYPSETTGIDPNHVAGLDGPNGGIAEMPTGFGLTSGLIQRVQVSPGVYKWLYYIGSKNGKVYCLDTQGRGDKTTTRRWTWPNDYPSLATNLNVGEIVGSVTFGQTSVGGNPAADTIYVPTQTGRIYALDAVGDDISKVTTETWIYPKSVNPAIGSVKMTPANEFNSLYFGAGDARFYCLSLNDADSDGEPELRWVNDGSATGAAFVPFGSSSPATGSAALVGGGMPNTVFFGNDNNNVYALNADDGSFIWRTDEVGSGPSGSAGLSYVYTRDATNAFRPFATPLLTLGFANGAAVGFNARLNDLNRYDTSGNASIGKRASWGYQNVSESNAFSFTSFAQSTRIIGGTDPLDEEFGWMYTCDSRGYVYAFNYDPDFPDGSQGISPGVPPLGTAAVVANPVNEVLRDIQTNGQVLFILPRDYYRLREKAQSAGLTWADVESAARTSKTKLLSKVTRTTFEFGESLYLMVYNLPDPDSNGLETVNYNLRVELNVGQASVQQKYMAPLLVTGQPLVSNRIAIAEVPIQPTGNMGAAPGTGAVRIYATAQSNRGAGNLSILASNFLPAATVRVANPLALSTRRNGAGNTIGYTTDVNSAEVQFNGNFTNSTGGQKSVTQPYSVTRTEVETGAATGVEHGTNAESGIYVYDRSLMTLKLGVGLQNVRYRPGDLNVLLSGNTDVRIGALPLPDYTGFEDDPRDRSRYSSLDYPDVSRDLIRVIKDQNGQTQNPAFTPVGLVDPVYSAQNLTDYNTVDTVYNVGLPRTLRPTDFALELSVPKYQPTVLNGYLGTQFVYVDPNNTQNIEFTINSTYAHRWFDSSMGVNIDQRPVVDQATIDLGSMPAGAGYSPLLSTTDGDAFFGSAMFNSTAQYYQDLHVFNDGNVNLLNVRLAKAADSDVNLQKLGTNGNSYGAWLDAKAHMHSDLDPNFSTLMPFAQRIVQKPRVGDGAKNRLTIFPFRRANPNIGVIEDPNPIRKDPRLAVSPPIGTPVGIYKQKIYVIEDLAVNNPTDQPVLNALASGGYEPYADAIDLIFTVRESRLTSSHTAKSAPLVDTYGDSNPKLLWNNQEPTAARDGRGNMYVAFSSDRRDGTGPTFNPQPKATSDAGNTGPYYLYFTSLAGSQPNASNAATSASGLNDLDNWIPYNNNQWFQNQTAGYPSGVPSAVFGVPAGWAVDPTTVQYVYPSFSSNGFTEYDQVGTGSLTRSTFIAFVGIGRVTRGDGSTATESRLFLAPVTVADNGTITPATPVPLTLNGQPYNPLARFGRPSVVHKGNEATVFFTTTASGQTQVNWANYSNGNWISAGSDGTGRLKLTSAFESVNSVAATLRPSNAVPPRLSEKGVIQLIFGARLRGRTGSDMYIASMYTENGHPLAPRNSTTGYLLPWQTQFAPLVFDSSTNAYWSLGVDLLNTNQDINGSNSTTVAITQATAQSQRFIDIMRKSSANEFVSVIKHETKVFDSESGILSAETVFGGKVIIDLMSGSVKFTGGYVPDNAALYFRSTPRYVRLAGAQEQAYRGAGIAFDNGPIVDRNYVGGPGFQFNGTLFYDPNANVAVDRIITTFVKTPAGGNAPPRQYIRPLRVGVQLSAQPYVNDEGYLTNFRVNGNTGGYQVDPVRKTVYFTHVDEAKPVQVTYSAIAPNGGTLNVTESLTVGIVAEADEWLVPIEQRQNDSPAFIALDPNSNPFLVNAFGDPRPRLMWLFWSSTRTGNQDVYFETVSPRFISQPH
ncbi:MAG: PQQ-binding-like beta-propeller repeat protein [Armatimonadetes bacterium]|nr:PQQ-binding-like beta-propeller repeat protein [Armatimonadota bacterium]